jgi:formate hydrogenlyase transcriptional activator
VLGTLDLAAFAPDAFSPDQFGLLTRIAGQIAIALNNAVSYERIEELNAQLAQEKLYLQDEIRSDQLFEDIIGRSAALRRVLREIETVAPTDSTVLISGETGSGKELVARGIHQLSARRDAAFVKLNCAAIPTGLLESELFGHEKGAFTGAIAQRVGRFELANRGTVFLDEIGEMAPGLQAKLLRFLEERTFKRVGGLADIRVDVRVVAATNRDLEDEVKAGKFREDLFYRLQVMPVMLPPLRERRGDIRLLVAYYIDRYNREFRKRVKGVTPDALAVLEQYRWPGNVRELRNAIERAMLLVDRQWLLPEDFATLSRSAPASTFRLPPEGVNLEAVERQLLVQALERAGGNQTQAGHLLGINRDQVRYRIEKFGLPRPQGETPNVVSPVRAL